MRLDKGTEHHSGEGQAAGIPVLYEDNHLLVVIKPPGIPSQEDDSGAADMLTLLKDDLKKRYNKPGNVFLGLVHRLDRPVGGVMLFAKTSKAASRLSESVRSHQFGKTYAAVLHGTPVQATGKLKHFLLKDKNTNTVKAVSAGVPQAKEARLDYTAIASRSGYTLTAVRLHTGRSHQIRVQMAALGCPLAGDRKYGNDHANELEAIADVALWSTSIEVAHPVTKEVHCFRSVPPACYPWTVWPHEQLEQAAAYYIGQGD